MQYTHSKDKAKQFYDQALDKIQSLDLPLLPEIYELWYTHFAGENPELSHTIDIAEKENKKIDLAFCANLYKTFFSKEKEAETVREAGSKIQNTIEDVNVLVLGVKDSTSQYNEALTDVSKKLTNGNYSQDEMQALLQNVVQNTESVLTKNMVLEEELNRQARAMEALQKDLERVRHEAMTDSLTNLSNRKAFENQMTKLIDTAENKGETFSIILMDIDHFKEFNDSFGHQVGDQVLRLVAKTLVEGIKGRDFVARYGGEEFAILLPGTNQHAGERVANALRDAVAKKEIINRSNGEKMGRITLSGGITEYYNGDIRDDLVERADKALYEAKDKGRNCIKVAKIELVRDTKA